ncbi:MAG: tetratricopeptide repeat protein [Myxococcales bacterium]|nr:tetratricopeptide repeat protein [Myxococcales bacterium]
MRGVTIRWLLPLLCAAALGGCQADEEKLADHLGRGEAYFEDEQYAEAIIEYKNVLQIDPNHGGAHWGLARAYLRSKQTPEGFWELRETARLDPGNLEAKLQFGQIAVFAGELDGALEQAEDVIAADPGRVTAYLLKGRVLEALQRPTEAQEVYEQAIEVDPESGAALLLLAIFHRRHGDRDAAEPLYRKLIEVEPTSLSYTALGGFLAQDRGRDAEAEGTYRTALELAEPEQRARAIAVLSGFYFSRDRIDDAVAVLEEGIRNEEDPLDLIYLLARFHRSQGDTDKADELIRQATEARPDDPRPQLILSSYLGRKRDLEGALAAADRAVELDPENDLARLRKAEVLVELGYRESDPERIGAGRAIIDAILEREPSHPGALFVKAKIDLAEREVESAVTALRAAIDARPDWAQAHFVLGTALALRGESTMARAELARSLEIDAGLVDARKVLAKVYLKLREYDYAVDEGRRYLRERPDDVETRVLVAQSLVMTAKPEEALAELQTIPEEGRDATALYALGRVHNMLANVEEARRFLLLAYEQSPENPEILGGLMVLDTTAGRAEESDARIQAAVRAKPDDPRLHRLLGNTYLRQNRGEEAEESFRRAIELDPTNVDSYNQLAVYYRQTGRIQETIRVYETAVQAVPDDAGLHHFLGVLYDTSGQRERAIEQYRTAIRYAPDLAEAKNNLAYLYADADTNLDRALELAQEAKALLPADANTADTLGWVLYKRGIPSAAITYFREAEAGMEPTRATIGVVRHHLALAYEANGEPASARAALRRAFEGLERRREWIRAMGAPDEPEPAWVSEARTLLARLPEAPPEESGPATREESASAPAVEG